MALGLLERGDVLRGCSHHLQTDVRDPAGGDLHLRDACRLGIEPFQIFVGNLDQEPVNIGQNDKLDYLTLNWGDPAEPFRLLIDAGRDSTADAVQAYLERHGWPKDIFEHGSRGNVSLELVKAVKCDRGAISTNGSQFKNPDREAIARIISGSPGLVGLFFNYDTTFTRHWHNPRTQAHAFMTKYGDEAI